MSEINDLNKQLHEIPKTDQCRVDQNSLIYRNMVLRVLIFQKQTLSKMNDKTFYKHINKEINFLLDKIHQNQRKYNDSFERIGTVCITSGSIKLCCAAMHKYQSDLITFLNELKDIIE